jgi:hypothetical protein
MNNSSDIVTKFKRFIYEQVNQEFISFNPRRLLCQQVEDTNRFSLLNLYENNPFLTTNLPPGCENLSYVDTLILKSRKLRLIHKNQFHIANSYGYLAMSFQAYKRLNNWKFLLVPFFGNIYSSQFYQLFSQVQNYRNHLLNDKCEGITWFNSYFPMLINKVTFIYDRNIEVAKSKSIILGVFYFISIGFFIWLFGRILVIPVSDANYSYVVLFYINMMLNIMYSMVSNIKSFREGVYYWYYAMGMIKIHFYMMQMPLIKCNHKAQMTLTSFLQKIGEHPLTPSFRSSEVEIVYDSKLDEQL